MKDYAVLNYIKCIMLALDNNGTSTGTLRLGTLTRANFIENFRKELVIESLTNSLVRIVENKKRKVREYTIKVKGKKIYTIYAEDYERIMREHNALSAPSIEVEIEIHTDETRKPYILTALEVDLETGEVLTIKEVNYNDDEDLQIQINNLRNHFKKHYSIR